MKKKNHVAKNSRNKVIGQESKNEVEEMRESYSTIVTEDDQPIKKNTDEESEDNLEKSSKDENETKEKSNSNEEEEDDEDEDEDETEEDEESEESESPECFIKTMSMRRQRGTKMAALEQKEKLGEGDSQDDNDFWKDNKYFGKIEEVSQENSEEQSDFDRDVEEHSDSYDEDFGKTSRSQSVSDNEGEDDKNKKGNKNSKGDSLLKKRGKFDLDDNENLDGGKISISKSHHSRRSPQKLGFQSLKRRKKKIYQSGGMDIQNEINKVTSKVKDREVFKKKAERKSSWRPKFIHEVFNQEDLQRNAVYEEQLNQISLQKLMLFEENKKKLRNSSQLKKNEPKHVKFFDTTKLPKQKFPKVFYNPKFVQSHLALKIAYDQDYDFVGNNKKRESGKMIQEDIEVIDQKDCDDNSYDDLNCKKMFKYFDPLTKSFYNTIEEFQKLRAGHYENEEKKIQSHLNLCEQLFNKTRNGIINL